MIKEITHNNNTVIFNPKYHSYHMKGTNQKLIGVTTFIKKFFPKFNTEQVAIDVGRKRGVCPESLKKEWKEKSTKSINDGNAIHEYAEFVFGNGDMIEKINHRIYLLMQQLDKVALEFWGKGYKQVETEKIIFSPSLGMSGTIDLLMKKLSTILIIDFKTSENMALYNPFQNAFKPINHLEDANLVHYSLQLNLYQLILETEKYFDDSVKFKRIIVHLTENDYVPYVCRDMRNEINSMLI